MARDMPMSPRERAAVAREVARNQHVVDRHRSVLARLAAIRPRPGRENVPAEQNRVKMARTAFGIRHQKELDAARQHPATRDEAKKVEAAAFGGDFGKGALNQLVGKTAEDFVHAGIYTPVGVYEAGKAGVQDAASTVRGHPTLKHTGHLAKQVAESTKQTVEHPLRHPGDTILLGLGALSGGAGAVSRVRAAGEAAGAARAAGTSAAKAALTRPGHEGGSLLRKPVPGMRHHRVGDLDVTGIHSSAPGVRHVEEAVDRARGRHAAKGPVETVNIRAAGTALGQNRRVQEAAGRAHAARLTRMGRKLTRPQQQALRVWGQGLTVDEKIAKYKQDIADVHASELPDSTKASMGKALADKIALTEAARPYFKHGTSELADTFETPRKRNRRKGADANHLKAVAAQADRVAGEGPHGRTRALVDAGVLEPEQASFRVNAPGRLALGAEWTTSAQEAVRRLNDIETQRAAIKGQPRVVPGKVVETARPRTREEAHARLTQLDEAVQPLIDTIAKSTRAHHDVGAADAGKRARSRADWIEQQHKPRSAETGLPPEDQALWEQENLGQTYQDYLFSKGAKGRKSNDAYAADAEEILHQLAGGTPNHEVPLETLAGWADELKAQGIDRAKLKKALDERQQLRHALGDNRSVEDIFGPENAVQWKQPRDDNGVVVHDSTDGQYQIQEGQGVVALTDGQGHSISTYDTVDEAKRGAQHNADILSGRKEPGPMRASEPDYGQVVSRTREPDKVLPPEIDEAGLKALADLDRREREAFDLLDQGGEPFLVGAEGHQGRFRVPDVRVKEERRRLFGPSVYRGGQPRKPGSLRYGYSGALESTGRFRVNTTQETARSALEGRHYVNALELRDMVLSSGRRQRPPDTRTVQWVPVREKNLTPKQRRMLHETAGSPASEALETTAGEAAQAGQWADFLESLFPEQLHGKVEVGAEVPNVVWVPRQFLHDLNAPFVRQNPGIAAALGVFDTTMNLVKFGVIPLKTAYLTANAAGNLIFNGLQQGVFLPRNWTNAVKMLRDDELGPVVREVMGSGGMRSLVDGNPRGIQMLNHAMHTYGHVMSELMAEPMMRVSSLAHEAERFGFHGVEGMRRLFNDPALAPQRDMIVRRANNAIVDYDRMGPVEKAVARRVLFIYPWVKGATLYAGHFLLEHPVQSAVYSQLAEVGREKARQDIGDVPSWAEGTFKVGGSHDFPLTVNPAQISPLGQAADIAQVGMGMVSPGGGSMAQFGSLLHPALQAAIEAAYKRDTFTGAPLQGSTLGLFARRAAGQIAPVALKQNLDKAGQPPGDRAFPMTRAQAWERFGIGSFMPRTANRAALNEAARREQEENLTPGQRARRKVFREREQVWQTMRQHDPSFLDGGHLPAEVKQAYNREATVEAARAEARHHARGDSTAYYRDVAVREARLLEQWGQVPPGFASTVRGEVQNLGLDAVKAGVDKLRRDLMGKAYRDITSEGRKYLKSRSS